MKFRFLKYTLAFALPASVVVSFSYGSWWSFLPLVFAFIFMPLLEFFLGTDHKNLEGAEAEFVRRDPLYDFILYLTVPIQVCMLVWFLSIIGNPGNEIAENIGWVIGMGLMCGVFGINIAHELGHRSTPHEKFMAKLMLCSSLYMHFYIEHNRGHHRNVGTPEDSASAKLGEGIYAFWIRTVTGSFISAWRIVKKERERKKMITWSLGNEMIQFIIIEALACGLVVYFFGWMVLLNFVISALIGILLLEAVNYVEHYGLRRQKINEFRYEDVQPWHSWNSDYIVGRLMLFELTRHSDHHGDPSKHYEVLNAMPRERELPAGYPTMIILTLVPPLWFAVMDKRASSAA